MPLYEYRCHKCGQRFEAIQKFSDAPLTVHADCGGEVERLISAPAFQFKGSGWYITDYAKSGGGSSKPGSGSEKNEAKADSSKKSDSSSSSTSATPASSSSSDSGTKSSS